MASGRTLIVSCIVTGVLAGVPTVYAQFDESRRVDKSERVIVSVPMQDGNAVEFMELLSRLRLHEERVAVSHSPHNDALILAGDPKTVGELQQSIKELAKTLNALAAQRAEERQPPAHVTVFQLAHVKAEQARDDIMRLNLPDVRFATDPKQNRLLAQGSEEALNQVRTVLEILDVPARATDATENLQVRFVWLVSKELAGEGGRAPSEDLAEVLTALKKAGVGELAMAAQAIVNVRAAGTGFDANGTAELQLGRTLFRAEGHLMDRTEEAARVEVSLTAERESSDPEQPRLRGQVRPLTSLRTAITARPGQAIVLGMTPIDSMDSIFVIQLLE